MIRAYISAVTKAYTRAVIPGSGLKKFSSIPEVNLYATGLTTPLSAGQITKLNTFVSALKTGLSITNLSDAFDVLKLYAGETAESSVKNLIKDAHHSTLVNSPTFTQYEGFAGNGTSNYIEENWNGRIAGHAVRYSLNSASYGLYLRSFDRGTLKIHGVYSTTADGGTENRIMLQSTDTTNLAFLINSTVPVDITSNVKSGVFIASRLNSSDFSGYINKSKTDIIGGSTNIPNQSIVTLARRTVDASVGLYNTSQVSFVFLGKGFTETEVGIIIDAMEAYMDSNGKGVIA